MRHDRSEKPELTHFEERTCHALADAHSAIRMLSQRLAERGLLSAAEAADVLKLTDRDLNELHELEQDPATAHSCNSEDEEIEAMTRGAGPLVY
jgi:hypothetical protein